MDQDPEKLGYVLGGMVSFVAATWGVIKLKSVRLFTRKDPFEKLYETMDKRFQRMEAKYEDTQRMLHTYLVENGERVVRLETKVDDHGRRITDLERGHTAG